MRCILIKYIKKTCLNKINKRIQFNIYITRSFTSHLTYFVSFMAMSKLPLKKGITTKANLNQHNKSDSAFFFQVSRAF